MRELPLIDPETATAETAALLAAVQRTAGITPNLVKAMANSPATLQGYLTFIVALRDRGELPAPLRARVAVLVAQEYESDYCLSAHIYLGVNACGLSDAEAARARAGKSDDPAAEAALAFTAALLRTRGAVTGDDLAAADAAGLTPGQRVEIVAQVALGTVTGLLAKAGRIDNDWPLVRHTDDLPDSLEGIHTRGGPIQREGIEMEVVRTHHYTVDPADLHELLDKRATLISAIRAAQPGLTKTRLTRLDDGTYTDTWHWDSAEQMQAALAALPTFPQARAAMSLTQDGTAQNGELIDER